MGIEIMIYIYGAVCVSMIGFNIVYNLAMRRKEPRLEKRCQKLQERVNEQVAAIRRGQDVDDRHLEYLERKLRHVNALIAYDQVLQSFPEEAADTPFSKYLQQIQPIILHLALIYCKRDTIQAAYFSYFLSRYITKKQQPIDSLQVVLLQYLRKDSLYCLVNALQALFTFGNTDNILKALIIQDTGGVFLHEKILTEGLLSFTGDHDQLIQCLWGRLDDFSTHTQLAILNYIRFRTGLYTKEMFAIMEDRGKDKELRLAAIRYFGRYPYEPALESLLAFMADKDPAAWEYAAVSASSLARYPEERVVDALKEALHSSNWYVRYNASVSLDEQGVNYDELIDVVAGNDRYAREMIMYRLEVRKLQEALV